MTAIWLPVYHSDPEQAGSIGVGFLLNPPIALEARAAPGAPGGSGGIGSVRVVEERSGVSVSVTPLGRRGPRPGRGYAVSAAAAIAAAFAASLLLGRTASWALRLAHVAEVEAGTGLGDVIAMAEARFMEIRVAPGAPGVGRVDYVPLRGSEPFILAELGEMTTMEMHRILGYRLYSEAAPRLRRVFENPCLDKVLEEARGFSLALGMLPRRLDRELAGMRGVRGWYVKKRLLVVVAEEDSALDVLEAVRGLRGVKAAALYHPSPTPYTVIPRGSRGATQGTGASS